MKKKGIVEGNICRCLLRNIWKKLIFLQQRFRRKTFHHWGDKFLITHTLTYPNRSNKLLLKSTSFSRKPGENLFNHTRMNRISYLQQFQTQFLIPSLLLLSTKMECHILKIHLFIQPWILSSQKHIVFWIWIRTCLVKVN